MRAQFIISFIFFTIFLHAQHANCDLRKDTDDIKVYTCKTENEKFRSLIAEFELKDTSPDELQKFLWDVKGYVNWQYNMVESEMLSETNANELNYRSLIDAPWPVENRELVLNFKIERNAGGMMIYIRHTEGENPPPDNVVRVPYFDGIWTVTVDGKNLKVTYKLKIDPGGSVPAWLANLAMAEGPYVSFKKLKEQIEKK